MSSVEKYFETVNGSKRFAYLQEGCRRDTDIPQEYNQLVNLISLLENVNPNSLYLKRGILFEDTNMYVSAEIHSDRKGISYVYFNASNDDTKISMSVLAKISESDMEYSSEVFFRGDCDSRENPLLRNNQVVVGGKLIESQYLALCIDEVWYEYKDRGRRESLISTTVNVLEDLVPV